MDKHLEQLKILYSELTYTTRNSEWFSGIAKALTSYLGASTTHKKECYPKEDYDAFIVRMLDRKKKRIEEELDV